MEKFKELINVDGLDKLLEKNRLSLEDRYKIASVTCYTLVDKIGDLKNEELKEVYYLESKNIFKVINTVSILLGKLVNSDSFLKNVILSDEINILPVIFDENSLLSELVQSRLGFELLDESNNYPDKKQQLRFIMFAKLILGDLKPENLNQPVFDGKIPKKTFAFRQMSAQEWFKDYVDFVLKIAAEVLVKMDAENAFLYILTNTAWYLNKSQTFKYHKKSTDKDMEATILRILDEFLTVVDEKCFLTSNNLSAPLYKDL